MIATELKPCPFCGGEARVNTLKWVGGYTATALCKNEPNCHYIDTWDEDEEKAIGCIIEAWNRRAERTCRFIDDSDGEFPPKCSACGYEPSIYECSWLGDGGYEFEGNYCPNCGAKVVE